MMHHNLPEYQRYLEIRPFFDELIASSNLAADQMSAFWRANLKKRHNFPTFNEMLTFRRGLASAVGYSFQINEETEQQVFLRMFGRAQALAPLEYLQANQESSVGMPYQFFKAGILSSSAGVDNVANAYRIETVLQEYHVAPPEHRILEIGAGYGGVAEVLIRRLNPTVYIICDLPQNLFLSAYYLAVNFPDRRLYFVTETAPESIEANALVFATPKGLEQIQEHYTLIVNTFSFQEMPLAEVRRYFGYIRDHLADDGLFYFFNHHRVAEGAQKPGDYPFDQFAVRHWGPLSQPQQYFLGAKQAYEVIMQRSRGEALPAYFDTVTDTLSLLMFMALNSNLSDISVRLLKSTIPDEELAYLAALHAVITSDSLNTAKVLLARSSSPGNWLPVTLYVSGLLRFFGKDTAGAAGDFKSALENGLSGFAKTRALAFLHLVESSPNEYLKQAIENNPQFQADLEAGIFTVEQFKLAYLYAFPNLHLDRHLIPRRLRRMLARK